MTDFGRGVNYGSHGVGVRVRVRVGVGVSHCRSAGQFVVHIYFLLY